MLRRVTIMLNESVEKKLRNIQAKEIRTTNKNVSFSKTINTELEKALK